MIIRILKVVLALFLLVAGQAFATDWWASEVISWNRLGDSPYDDPFATLGKPSTWMDNSGAPGDLYPCAIMIVAGAWNVGLQGEKLVTTIRGQTSTLPAGHITVKFTTPIYDDPGNWYGKDFIVFGNSSFAVGGSYVYSDSDMEQIIISAYGGGGWWEPMPVSVSQDGITWYTYEEGPYADDYAPTHAFAWDWVEGRWLRNSVGQEVELDLTRPVGPIFTKADYDQKNVAQAIDMYRGSGGGTAFDLAHLPLPADPVTGRKWIQYIRTSGSNGEVDAFARVSREITPMSVSEAKRLPDGSHVALGEAIVSAGTYEVGRYCYVQQENRSSGMKVIGRVLERDKRVIIWGDMDTMDGERVILATAVDIVKDALGNDVTTAAKSLGMLNKSIGGGDFFVQLGQTIGQKGVLNGNGLNNIGLLVTTCGRVTQIGSGYLYINDGSALRDGTLAGTEENIGVRVICDPTGYNAGDYLIVIGISSCFETPSGLARRVLIRRPTDIRKVFP